MLRHVFAIDRSEHAGIGKPSINKRGDALPGVGFPAALRRDLLQRHAVLAVMGMAAVAAGILGGIQRRVGAGHEHLAVVGEHGLGQPRADGDIGLRIAKLKSVLGDGAADPFGDRLGFVQRRARKDHPEFFAAVAGDKVLRANTFEQHLGDLLQDGVAGDVSVFVVDVS